MPKRRVSYNRQTAFLTGQQNLTIYGTLDPEDRVSLVYDRYPMLEPGRVGLRVVRLGPATEAIDVCAGGAPLAAAVGVNAESTRFEVDSTIDHLVIRRCADPVCSGETHSDLAMNFIDATSYSLLLDSGSALLCNDATTPVGRPQSTCVRIP